MTGWKHVFGRKRGITPLRQRGFVPVIPATLVGLTALARLCRGLSLGLSLSLSLTLIPGPGLSNPSQAETQADPRALAPAQAPNSFPDFSAKRIKPPAPGAKRLITIQIAPPPEVAAQPAAPAPAGAQPTTTPQPYDWFWAEISPRLEAASPARLEEALALLAARTDVAAPRVQTLQELVSAHKAALLTSTVGTQVSPALALAVMAVESAGQSEAVSAAGAQGLMQLMPDTARRFGVEDAMDPRDNIAGGVRFLDFLVERFEGDAVLVLAAYNAGEGAVGQYEGVPPFAETRAYVPKVLAAYRLARALCVSPPIMMTDGCVFASP